MAVALHSYLEVVQLNSWSGKASLTSLYAYKILSAKKYKRRAEHL